MPDIQAKVATVDDYARILNENGGTMVFADFVQACAVQRVNAQGWKRAKDRGLVNSWIDPNDDKHYISTKPAPSFDYEAIAKAKSNG